MPETYLNGEEVQGGDPAELIWDSIPLDWPIEVVMTEAEVVVSREPSALEWVVPHDIGKAFLRERQSKADSCTALRSSAQMSRWRSLTWTG